ncbi:hypothetical protein FA15DRAFT_672925 [Coprinopsis marcescibilis]|uniref:DUF6534 domain-containing protein n=1 Tax=Coprinopsis marcescibilis TaxID=230819 RepID=A0A5C3KM11_COPMA|nr:hypothetical protein FA15DRAFT_672925 [Coprinopsis marcescibilis]
MSSTDPDSTVPREVQRLPMTIGAILIGTMLASILYGYTCYLTYRYSRHYKRDKIGFKIFVGALWLVDTLHTVFSMHLCYDYLVTNYFNPAALETIVWSLQASLFVSALAPLLSNGFYLSRLFIIGQRNIFLIAGLALLVISRLGLEFSFAILSFIHPRWVDLLKFNFLVKAFCSISTAADVGLSILVCWYLHRGRTGYERTDDTIDLVIAYTFSTGLLTGITCFISLLAVFLSLGLVDLAVHAILGKLYVNSVLAVLNSRKSHRTKPESSIYEATTLGMSEEQEKLVSSRASAYTATGTFMGAPYAAATDVFGRGSVSSYHVSVPTEEMRSPQTSTFKPAYSPVLSPREVDELKELLSERASKRGSKVSKRDKSVDFCPPFVPPAAPYAYAS